VLGLLGLLEAGFGQAGLGFRGCCSLDRLLLLGIDGRELPWDWGFESLWLRLDVLGLYGSSL
jgi:hypothetical protein